MTPPRGGGRPVLREGGGLHLFPAGPGPGAERWPSRGPLRRPARGLQAHTGSGLPGAPTQFSRAMDELGVQMIFALSPQAKGRVERTAGTFQDRLVTELRLAGASSIGEANGVLEQFLPRYNRRSGFPRNAPSPRTGRWTLNCPWSRYCASNTAGRWPGTIR